MSLRSCTLAILILALGPAESRAVDANSTSPATTITSEELRSAGVNNIADLLDRIPNIRSLPTKEIGLNVFYQDAHVLQTGAGGTFGTAVIGAGATFNWRPNAASGLFYRFGVGYGVGSEKFEDPVAVLKGSTHTLYGNAGIGGVLAITRKSGVYGTAGLSYSTTGGSFDNGTTETDFESFNVFGLDTSVGVRFNARGSNSIFLEQYSVFGWGSGEDGDNKYNESVKYGCFRGGYLFGF